MDQTITVFHKANFKSLRNIDQCKMIETFWSADF